jgi:hypothetical protein
VSQYPAIPSEAASVITPEAKLERTCLSGAMPWRDAWTVRSSPHCAAASACNKARSSFVRRRLPGGPKMQSPLGPSLCHPGQSIVHGKAIVWKSRPSPQFTSPYVPKQERDPPTICRSVQTAKRSLQPMSAPARDEGRGVADRALLRMGRCYPPEHYRSWRSVSSTSTRLSPSASATRLRSRINCTSSIQRSSLSGASFTKCGASYSDGIIVPCGV